MLIVRIVDVLTANNAAAYPVASLSLSLGGGTVEFAPILRWVYGQTRLEGLGKVFPGLWGKDF